MWDGFLASAGELKQGFHPCSSFSLIPPGHNSHQIPPSIKKKHEQESPTTLEKPQADFSLQK